MILTALADYYDRLQATPGSGVSPYGYSKEKISYAIVLDRDGRVVDVHDLRDMTGRKPQPRIMDVPQFPEKRTAGIRPNFLWDKTSYALGVSAKSSRSDQEYGAFKDFHRETLAGSDDPGLQALLAFLGAWTPDGFKDCPHMSRHGESFLDANVVFRLDGDQCYLHERPAARAVWAGLKGRGDDASEGMCLVTGMWAPIARIHPPIKGVDGAQSSGASIVSFNLDAFRSYGKSQGDNAPISEQAAFAYTTALNHLLRQDPGNRQRLKIGDTTVVFWARARTKEQAEAAEDVISAFLQGDGGEDTSALEDRQATQRLFLALEQVRQGRPLRELDPSLDDEAEIFVLGLAPNASRLSVRFWETQSLSGLARRLADHYADLALEPAAWQRPPTPWRLARQVAPVRGEGKSKAEDVPPLLAGELTRSILTGTRYPRSLLAAILMRFRADGQITPLRVALCKAVLARDARLNRLQGISSSNKGEPPVSLDTRSTDPGYLLGRLFATLENLQRAAIGDKVATIRDRYYGAASATPAGIFPVLLRNAQNHLGKLRKDKPGLAVNIEKEIGEIIDALPPMFPRTLSIDEQGRFTIGYYHQGRARFGRGDGQNTDIDTVPKGEQE